MPGAPFFATDPDPRTLRLSFTTHRPAEIVEGLERLRRRRRGRDVTARDVPIREDTIRLGQLLKLAGLAESGGHARELVQDGRGAGQRRGRDCAAGASCGAATS